MSKNITLTKIEKFLDKQNSVYFIRVAAQIIDSENPDYLHGVTYDITGADLWNISQIPEGTAEFANAIIDYITVRAAYDYQLTPIYPNKIYVDLSIFGDMEYDQDLYGDINVIAANMVAGVIDETVENEATKKILVQAIKTDRKKKEAAGIPYVNNGVNYLFDTDFDSQSRIAAARLAILSGYRVDPSKWKVYNLDQKKIDFVQISNGDLETLAGQVHTHVQKCFDAEANALTKVYNNDFTASFDVEFQALNN